MDPRAFRVRLERPWHDKEVQLGDILLSTHLPLNQFVDAVMAGCVPIYHAHETVRDTVLVGARWVDPAEFDSTLCAHSTMP
jgi:hypothetical protein